MLYYLIVHVIIPCIIGIILGLIIGKIISKKTTYGQILIDHETEQMVLQLNTEDLQNRKIKRVEIEVIHDAHLSQ